MLEQGLVRGALVLAGASGIACADSGSVADTSGPSEGSEGSEGSSSTSGETGEPDPSELEVGCDLPLRHVADLDAAALGETALAQDVLGGPLVPAQAMRNLSLVWGSGLIADDDAYWAQLRARYGLFEAPWPNDGLPLGVQRYDANFVTFNCLLCHAGAVDGELHLGLANTQLDLQGLFDELVELADIAENFGLPAPQLPWTIEDRTGAAGLTDAFGMGMQFATAYGPGGGSLETRYGYQDPGAWWRVKLGDTIYADGSGDALGHRTMMAMLLAFGLPYAELQALDPTIEALREFVLSIEAPSWPGPELDLDAQRRGRLVFDEHCASCHGIHSGPEASYPNALLPLDSVDTDPTRAINFGPEEAAWINASWFGQDHPMSATGSYIAPPLCGVWASAPYLHNGSVPTLAALLEPETRPLAWRALARPDEPGAWDYEQVGLAWEAVEGPMNAGETIEQRRVHDGRRAGLSAEGHDFGAQLSAEQRADLLEYLRGL